MNYSIADLSEKLSDRVEDVCQFLLPHGKRNANMWEVGDTSGKPGVSCKVNLAGNHPGKWKDWANESERGDLIDLWSAVKGSDRIETLRQVKDYLGVRDSVGSFGPPKSYQKPPESEVIKQISAKGKVMKYMTEERKLKPEIVDRFKIEGDGESIVYPYFDTKGQLVNRCYVKMERLPNGKKSVRQEKGCAPCLWGWHALTEAAYSDRRILICEGQIDAMTWTQWTVPALSVPNGSNSAWIEYEWENLELFSEIFLSFDMDGAGQENLRKVMNRLGLHRCRIIKLPHKDANEALKAGCDEGSAVEWLVKAEYPKYHGLRAASDYYKETIEEFSPSISSPKGYTHPLLEGYDGKMEFLPGDVTVWTGITSHGKTTWLNYMTVCAIMTGRVSFIASLEMKPARLISRMFKGLVKRSMLAQGEIDSCFKQVEDKLFFADKIGYIQRKELLDMMLFAYSRYGVEHIVIDSLMRIQGLEEDYPAQGDFLNELQAFSKQTNSHIHIVCHPRKTDEGTAPGKMDVKGSSLIMNNCDNLIAVHKNMEKEKIRRERPLEDEEDMSMHDAEIVSEKQRDQGWHGRVRLRFCNKTFTYSKFP